MVWQSIAFAYFSGADGKVAHPDVQMAFMGMMRHTYFSIPKANCRHSRSIVHGCHRQFAPSLHAAFPSICRRILVDRLWWRVSRERFP